MPNRVLTTVAGAALAACASSSTTPPKTPPKTPTADVPPLIVSTTNAVTQLAIRINDLPLSQREIAHYIPIPDEAYPVPAYFFRAGTNTLAIRYKGIAETTEPYELAVRLGTAELIGDFTTCTGTEAPCELEATFELDGIPAWNWQDGDDIVPGPQTRASLYAEYDKLLADWRAAVPRDEDGVPVAGKGAAAAKRLREELAALLPQQPAVDLDDLVTLIVHPASHLDDLAPDMPELDMGVDLEVFAGGKLARLWRQTIPILWFQGGAHDAPEGVMGPFDVGFDVWFRRAGDRWIVAAIWRTGVMPELPAV